MGVDDHEVAEESVGHYNQSIKARTERSKLSESHHGISDAVIEASSQENAAEEDGES